MVGLLHLPLELREPILLNVILETTQRPPDGPLSDELREGYEVVKAGGINADSRPQIYCKPLQSHSMPLLQVNRQIRYEVIDILPRKLGQRIDDAKLDVLFVEDVFQQLWGTWLSAPFPTSNLNTLHAEIRDFQILRSFSSHTTHPTASIEQDCRHWVVPCCADTLLKFLADFLQPGEGSTPIYNAQEIKYAAGSQVASRTIQNLAINIPLKLDQQDSLETRVRCSWCKSANANVSNDSIYRRIPSGKRAALIFAQSLHDQLRGIFDTTPRHCPLITCPRIVFETIGSIHLKVAGKLFASMDLGKILAEMPRSEEWNEYGVSRAEFFQWKRLTEEKRKTAGFTMVKSSVQEHELVGSAGIIASILSTRAQILVREVITISEDAAPSARLPRVNETVAFTGNAVFVQEDGSSLPGNATFYEPTPVPMPVVFPRWWTPLSDGHEVHRVEKHIKEQPQDGETVLFKGESILFRDRWMETTITSGEATFYGPAEEGRKEQSGAIEVDSPHVGDHRARFGT